MKNKTKTDLKKAAALLMEQDDIMILTHNRADGDTLGCAFALKEALEQLHKRAFVANHTDVTPRYAFLNGGQQTLPILFPPRFVVSVDVATPELLGETFRDTPIDLVLDHHTTNQLFGKILNVVAVECAACGEAILQLLLDLKVTLTPSIARALYTAIATDTGCFKFSNTTANTHRSAAKLMEVCSMEDLNQLLFQTRNRTEILIEQAAYESLEFIEDGAIAFVTLSQSLRERLGANEDDLDGISNLARSIEGVVIGFSVKELSPEEYKISVRTNGTWNASSICAQFGGGGHLHAAGCSLRGKREDVMQKLRKAAQEELRRGRD